VDKNDPNYGVNLQVISEMSEDWLAIAMLMDEMKVPDSHKDGRAMTLLERVVYALGEKNDTTRP
jgi:hypothetical protein